MYLRILQRMKAGSRRDRIALRLPSATQADILTGPTNPVRPNAFRPENQLPMRTRPHSAFVQKLKALRCPKCGGPMKVVERLTAAEIQLRSPPLVTAAA